MNFDRLKEFTKKELLEWCVENEVKVDPILSKRNILHFISEEMFHGASWRKVVR